MRSLVTLNGITHDLSKRDIDGDGITGYVERVSRGNDDDIQPISESTESGQIIDRSLEETISPGGVNTLEKLGNLDKLSSSIVLVLLLLHQLHFLSESSARMAWTRLRISLSEDARARNDILAISGNRKDDVARLDKWLGKNPEK